MQRAELPEELLAAIGTGTGSGSGTRMSGVGAVPVSTTLSAPPVAISIEDAERAAIVGAVKSMHGNLTQAARALGVSRSTLYRKVERYHLESLVAGPGSASGSSARSVNASHRVGQDLGHD